jgi:hypothetical protein
MEYVLSVTSWYHGGRGKKYDIQNDKVWVMDGSFLKVSTGVFNFDQCQNSSFPVPRAT